MTLPCHTNEAPCPVCGCCVRQVSSATMDLAMFQHMLWIHGVIIPAVAPPPDVQP